MLITTVQIQLRISFLAQDIPRWYTAQKLA